MADLTELQASQTVKIVGSNTSGGETNFAAVDADQRLAVRAISEKEHNTARPTTSILIGGSDLTNIIRPVQVDDQGRLVTSALTGFGAAFRFGQVTTAATTEAIVRSTTYTQPASQAQRSVSSANANDSSAGTGARTIMIEYYDNTGAGPFFETVTMNGTTPVNTVATNIRFVEQIKVVTVGSTGSNVGIITLFNATAGGGGAIGTIGATNNRTFWAHHYVPLNKIMNITGVSCSHSGTTVGSGAVFTVKSTTPLSANSPLLQESDFIRLYGQSSTFSRVYQSPIKISGFARVEIYVRPETSSSTIYRGAFDFFEP